MWSGGSFRGVRNKWHPQFLCDECDYSFLFYLEGTNRCHFVFIGTWIGISSRKGLRALCFFGLKGSLSLNRQSPSFWEGSTSVWAKGFHNPTAGWSIPKSWSLSCLTLLGSSNKRSCSRPKYWLKSPLRARQRRVLAGRGGLISASWEGLFRRSPSALELPF